MGTAADGLTIIGNASIVANSSGENGDLAVAGALATGSPIITPSVFAATVQLTSNPASTVDLGASFLHALTIPKAGGLLFSDGLGAVGVLDGAGITSVALAGSNRGWTVTLSHAMASTNYWVTATYTIVAGGNNTNAFVPKFKPSSTSGFDVLLQKSTDESYPDVSAAVYGVSIQVFGRHT